MIKLLSIMIMLNIASVYADPYKLNCTYSKYSNGKKLETSSELFVLDFIVDLESDKCYLTGNLGTIDVICVPNAYGLISLIEVTKSGNVSSTTVDNELKSVHSRNMIIMGKLTPSQYYGSCIKN